MRTQFFGLLDVFMSSPLVPAYTVGAVVKRLARHALHAPPGGALLAIAFIHNLIRRHPSLMVLLHNPNPRGSGSAEDKAEGVSCERHRGMQDPYDERETDPAKCRALESSLWEVEALRNHHCPHVSGTE
jgi:U3 small nucleolar RNA-associated protein 19